MNTYKKYCPNVFVAQCTEKHEKGEEITITTKYGKENEHIVYNLLMKKNGFYYYSIIRADGFNSQERAKNKVDKLENWAAAAEKRANEWSEKSQEGKEFLELGEPIHVGHHSEARHRALLDRNWRRIGNSVKEMDKAESYEDRASYWEKMAKKIDLSMPESIDFFKQQLEEAKEYHKGLKDGTIERPHSLALSYASKKVNDLKKKYELALKLWA